MLLLLLVPIWRYMDCIWIFFLFEYYLSDLVSHIQHAQYIAWYWELLILTNPKSFYLSLCTDQGINKSIFILVSYSKLVCIYYTSKKYMHSNGHQICIRLPKLFQILRWLSNCFAIRPNDFFRFDSSSIASNVNRILSFDSNEERIQKLSIFDNLRKKRFIILPEEKLIFGMSTISYKSKIEIISRMNIKHAVCSMQELWIVDGILHTIKY